MKKYVVIAGVNGAGKIAVKKIKQHMRDGISFNQETTLCGKSIIKNILKECNLIAFYDNTESFRRFAICKNGELVRISQNVPAWFSKVEIERK